MEADENVAWIAASAELCGRFYERGGKKAVVAGTCFEYDLSYGLLREDRTPLRPASLYGICKHAANLLIRKYADARGGALVWGRIFYVYGGDEQPGRLTPHVVDRLMAGESAVCGEGRQIRDYLHVSDVARAFEVLLDNAFSGDVNICSGRGVTVREFAEEIGRALGKGRLLTFDPAKNRAGEPYLIVGSGERLRGMGWRQEFDIVGGIRDVVRQKFLLRGGQP
jgi:nucleoside-diphosphate-sugar epimerase